MMAASRGGGSAIDWETIAKGMCDDSTHFSVPKEAFGTTIRYYTFYARRYLDGVEFPSWLTNIGNAAFQECTGLRNVVVPSGVTTLGNSVFQGCTGLVTVELPNTITTTGHGIFYNCTSLESANVPTSLTTMQMNFFYQCSKLTTMTIPSSITSIGIAAFRGCTRLAEIILQPTTPPTLGTNVFQLDTALAAIYVPDASVATYKATNGWSTYANIIKGISERPTT